MIKKYHKHWRDCCVCGKPVLSKSRITCSSKCSKENERTEYKSPYEKRKKEIKKQELKIRRLESKLSKKLHLNVFLPFRKPEDNPKCKICKNQVYIIHKKYYCDNCNNFVEIIKERKRKIWGKDWKGNVYYRCTECKSNDVHYNALGLCIVCYNKERRIWGQDHKGNKYLFCKKCKSSKYPHHSRGLCIKCYI